MKLFLQKKCKIFERWGLQTPIGLRRLDARFLGWDGSKISPRSLREVKNINHKHAKF